MSFHLTFQNFEVDGIFTDEETIDWLKGKGREGGKEGRREGGREYHYSLRIVSMNYIKSVKNKKKSIKNGLDFSNVTYSQQMAKAGFETMFI